MSLSSLINKAPKSVWVNLPESPIQLELCFMSRARFRSLSEAATVVKYDPAAKVHRQSVDGSKLMKSFLQETVKDWKNVTPRNLQKFLPLVDVPADKMDEEQKFSMEDLIVLMENSHNIDAFLQEAATDPQVFNPPPAIATEDVVKN